VKLAGSGIARAVWFGRKACGSFHAIHVATRKADPAVNAHWYRTHGSEQPLERLQAGEGHIEAVLEYVWGFPRGESDFVNVVVPEFFSRPSLVQAIGNRDYYLVQGCILAIGLTYVAVNFLTDLLYSAVNPRIRQ